jgi:hypothetical protein
MIRYNKAMVVGYWSVMVSHFCVRPVHTHAKCRDHEILRAQKKVSNGRPKRPPKSCSVVTDPQS